MNRRQALNELHAATARILAFEIDALPRNRREKFIDAVRQGAAGIRLTLELDGEDDLDFRLWEKGELKKILEA